MKTLLSILFFLVITSAGKSQSLNKYYFSDFFGNNYKSYENLWYDFDNDGYLNYLDRHDRNPNVGYFTVPSYSEPGYYENYKSFNYDFTSGKIIYEGSRGGKYYINKNGNKTYMK
ncbi:MAG: hypothetical protein N2510_05505 [Ignavibacteria bacterium]|nr:hypothetical protein [Ignavibacteria bacterium]